MATVLAMAGCSSDNNDTDSADSSASNDDVDDADGSAGEVFGMSILPIVLPMIAAK